MTAGHWQMILVVAGFLFFLGMFALEIRQGSRVYKGVQRIFWAFFGVWLAKEGGIMALNAATFLITAVFGVPGAAAVISLSYW